MQNKELKAGTNDEQRTAADSIPSASLVQNGVLSAALSWWQSLSVNERQNFRWKFGNKIDGYMSEEKLISLFKREKNTAAVGSR